MAGIILPNIVVPVTSGPGANLVTAVPVGKADSLCVSVALALAATADTYVDVYLTDPVTAPAGLPLIFNEPVRYRQPGGSPVLLLNFILTAGQSLGVASYVIGQNCVFTVFNRWRFDA